MKSSTTSAADNAIAATIPAQVADAGVYAQYGLARIRKSPDNRKRFDPIKLTELAASIKSMGVAQPILIRPVTPTAEQPEEFEIVAGERRYRASIIAGMTTIPAMCRKLSDVDAAKLRILENLQREDPHPIEEAEGFQMLMMQHGYSADQLAEEIKKSRAYVYARLKLCALTLDVRDQVLDGKVDASTALLVARIPVPALQVRAMAEILEGHNNHPMSYREAAKFTQENYMLDITKAEFDRGDAKLLAKAGACSKCPKRAGNQPEVFEGIGADVCTDPVCFAEKKAAHIDRIIVVSGKKGVPTFDNTTALEEHDPEKLLVRSDRYLNCMERFIAYSDSYKLIISKLNSANTPPIKAYLHLNGRLIPVFDKAAVQTALEEIGVCASAAQVKEKAAQQNETAPNEKRLAQMKAEAEALRKKEGIAQQETAFRVSLYKQFRSRAANGLSLQSLREFVKLILIDDNNYSLPNDLLDVYGLASYTDEDVAAYIDQANLPEVQIILIDLVLGECLGVDAHDVADDGTIDESWRDDGELLAALNAMASHEGIDPVAAREQFDLAALSIDDIDERNMHRFIRAYPERISELTKSIVDTRPHLVGALEIAAKDCGFAYIGQNAWTMPSSCAKPVPLTAAAGARDATEPLAGAPHPQGDCDSVACEGEDLEAAFAEPAPTKKAPKAKSAAKKLPAATTEPVKQTTLSPAGAWPFPKSSGEALEPEAAPAGPAKDEATNPTTEETVA